MIPYFHPEKQNIICLSLPFATDIREKIPAAVGIGLQPPSESAAILKVQPDLLYNLMT